MATPITHRLLQSYICFAGEKEESGVTVDKWGQSSMTGLDPSAANREIVEWAYVVASSNLDETFSCFSTREGLRSLM
jgi:hypothetical protein